MDPVTRRLALIAGGLGATLLLVVGGWSLIGHRNAPVPVVQADSRPVRVKPENPGGMQVAGANEDILSGGSEAKGGKLAPPPEAPAPQAMRAPPPPPPVAAAPPRRIAAPARLPRQAGQRPAKPVAAKPAAAPEQHPHAPAASGAQVQLAAVHSEEAAKVRMAAAVASACLICLVSISRRSARSTMMATRCGGCEPVASADIAQATSFCETGARQGGRLFGG